MITDPDVPQIVSETLVVGGPWWVNAILKLGVTTVIAVGLVWFVTQEVKTSLNSINASITAVAKTMNDQSAPAAIHERQTADVQLRLTQILQVLQVSCVNAAKDTSTRNACF